jgi:hypothetical protein
MCFRCFIHRTNCGFVCTYHCLQTFLRRPFWSLQARTLNIEEERTCFKLSSTNVPGGTLKMSPALKPRLTRSSSLIKLVLPANQSCLKLTNKSIHHTASNLWKPFPVDLQQVCYSAFYQDEFFLFFSWVGGSPRQMPSSPKK